MANHSCTAKLAYKILRMITRSLSRLDGLLIYFTPPHKCFRSSSYPQTSERKSLVVCLFRHGYRPTLQLFETPLTVNVAALSLVVRTRIAW
jgi:hypothetical protein